MNTQTGPYKEAETIDEDDIKRITGVVYGGKFSGVPYLPG